MSITPEMAEFPLYVAFFCGAFCSIRLVRVLVLARAPRHKFRNPCFPSLPFRKPQPTRQRQQRPLRPPTPLSHPPGGLRAMNTPSAGPFFSSPARFSRGLLPTCGLGLAPTSFPSNTFRRRGFSPIFFVRTAFTRRDVKLLASLTPPQPIKVSVRVTHVSQRMRFFSIKSSGL